MKNVIVHDCTGDKLLALQGACTHRLGSHNFEMIYFKYDEKPDAETPLTFEELDIEVNYRVVLLRGGFDLHTVEEGANIYYASIAKGFMQSVTKQWLFMAYAIFGKAHALFPGTADAVPLKPSAIPLMHLPSKERCVAFTTLYGLHKTNSLIKQINGTDQTDWYKQAFRTPVLLALQET